MSERTSDSVYKSELLFPVAMAAMLLGCFIFYLNGSFAAISAGAAITSACCAFLAFLQVKNLTINLVRIQVYLSAVAYFFPLSYLGSIDKVGLLFASNDQLAACSIMIIVSLSIGWGFSFLIRLNIEVPSEIPAFLRLSDIILLVAPACLYQLFMMATGKWSYESTHVAFLGLGEPISPLIIAAPLTFAIGPMVAYNYGLLRHSERAWSQVFITFAALSVGTAFWLIESRRSMVTFVLLSVAAFFLGRFKGQYSPKQILSMVLVLVVLGLGIAQANKFFNSMRLAREILGREQTLSMSIPDFLEYSRRIQSQPIAPDVAQAQAARPFIIDAASVLLPYLNHQLYGKEMAMQIISVIPSFMFPGKAKLTAEIGTMEDLWSNEYGFPLNDYANTFVLDGYIDFWYFGFLIYCIFSALCVQIVYRIYSIVPSLVYFCIFNNIALFLQVETALSSYLIYLRNMVFLFIPLWIAYAVIEASARIPASSKIPLRMRPRKSRSLPPPAFNSDISK